MATLRRLASWEEIYALKEEIDKTLCPKLDEPLLSGLIEILRLHLDDEATYKALKFVIDIISKSAKKMISIVGWFNISESLVYLMMTVFTLLQRLLRSELSQASSFMEFVITTCDVLLSMGSKCDEIHNSMVLNVSRPFFGMLNERNLLYPTKKEALFKLKPFLIKANIHTKKQLMRLNNDIFQWLAAWLCSCGDFELQDAILEVLTRYSYLSKQKLNILKFWFENCAEAASAVDLLDYKAYDLTCRLFLNAVNSASKAKIKVFSPPCLKAYGGEEKLTKPKMEGYAAFWIDFSCGTGVIHVTVDAGEGCWHDLSISPLSINYIEAETHLMTNPVDTLLYLRIGLKCGVNMKLPSGMAYDITAFNFIFLETPEMRNVIKYFFKKHFQHIFKEIKKTPVYPPAFKSPASVGGRLGERHIPKHISTPTKISSVFNPPPLFPRRFETNKPIEERQATSQKKTSPKSFLVETLIGDHSWSAQSDQMFSEMVQKCLAQKAQNSLSSSKSIDLSLQESSHKRSVETHDVIRGSETIKLQEKVKGAGLKTWQSSIGKEKAVALCSKGKEVSLVPSKTASLLDSYYPATPQQSPRKALGQLHHKGLSSRQQKIVSDEPSTHMDPKPQQNKFTSTESAPPEKPKRKRKLFNLKSWDMGDERIEGGTSEGAKDTSDDIWFSPNADPPPRKGQKGRPKMAGQSKKVRFEIPKPKPVTGESQKSTVSHSKKETKEASEISEPILQKPPSKAKKIKKNNAKSTPALTFDSRPGLRRSSRLQKGKKNVFFNAGKHSDTLSPPVSFASLIEREKCGIDPLREKDKEEELLVEAVCPSTPPQVNRPSPSLQVSREEDVVLPSALPLSPPLPVPSPPPTSSDLVVRFQDSEISESNLPLGDKDYLACIRNLLTADEEYDIRRMRVNDGFVFQLRSTFNQFIEEQAVATKRFKSRIDKMKCALDALDDHFTVDIAKQGEMKKKVRTIVEEYKKSKENDLKRLKEKKEILKSRIAKFHASLHKADKKGQ